MTEVTAKIFLARKSEGETKTDLVFGADYADGRNQKWAVNTPNLNVTMTVVPSVADHFFEGQPFTLTFTPSEH